MSARLGIIHKYRNNNNEIVVENWDGLYAVTNVDEPDWHWIEDLLEQYSYEDRRLELRIRISEKPKV